MRDTVITGEKLFAQSRVPGIDYSSLRRMALRDAAEYDYAVERDDARRIAVRSAYGRTSFLCCGNGAKVEIEAQRRDWLFGLKDAVIASLGSAWPETATALRWSDDDRAGNLPPNIQIGELVCTLPLGRDFLRVTLGVDDLSRFTDAAIHFRLGLPPRGARTPKWPRIGANGGTVWPTGDETLHLPVYTIRTIDPRAGTLTFDLFVHEGGRATNWARNCPCGSPVAVIGPGGGGIPVTRHLRAFGDETAFPAIARILADAPAPMTGTATLLARGGERCGYPMPIRPGVEIRWVDRTRHADLVSLAIDNSKGAPPHFLWFAGAKNHAQAVRSAFKTRTGTTRAKYVAAYWDG